METLENIEIDHQQQLYLLRYAEGFSCLSFQNAWDELLELLKLPLTYLVTPSPSELTAQRDTRLFGSLELYGHLQRARTVFADSKFVQQTFFARAASPELRKILEKIRKDETVIRVWYGDPATGLSDLQENDTIGRVGRSRGAQKIPLLLPAHQHSGGALGEGSLLCIRRESDGLILWQHKRFHLPQLMIERIDLPPYKFAVIYASLVHATTEHSRHRSYAEACGLLAWLAGEDYRPNSN